VVLAYPSDDGWTGKPLIDLLTPTGLARGPSVNNMSEADCAAYEKMLADAKSPQEAAYMGKALAAGYSLVDVRAFGQARHPHGDDLKWMSDHLDPHIDNLDTGLGQASEYKLNYKGQSES
jgi:hypothetical protein